MLNYDVDISIKWTQSKSLTIWGFITIFTGHPLSPVLSSHWPTLCLYVLHLQQDFVFICFWFPQDCVCISQLSHGCCMLSEIMCCPFGAHLARLIVCHFISSCWLGVSQYSIGFSCVHIDITLL